MNGGNAGDLYLVTTSADHSAAEINDSGASGSDELRFASTTANQILTVFAADIGLESVTIGTGVAAAAVTTATTALGINAAAAPNGLSIFGNAGNNTITGSAGIDTMDGGNGGDLYLVTTSADHSAAEINDSGASGSDELRFASTTAGQILTVFAGDLGLESVTIGTGTAAAAVITGATALSINAAAAPNGLSLSGNAGINTLTGTGYADILTGNGGIDVMNGGNGADLYLVTSSVEHGAAEINDSGASGSDELRFASTTAGQILTVFAADIGLESVTIGTGVAAAAVTTDTTALGINAAAAPNGLSIFGNAGNNTITGSAGIDTMDGGNGSDLYLVTSNVQHSAAEINDSGASGSDELRFASTTAGQTLTVFAADIGLESVTIGTGTAAAAVITGTTALSINAAAAPNGLSLSGNAGINTLTGTGFADILTGNGGIDVLKGGNGADLYLVTSSAEHGAAEINDNGASGSDELRFTSTTANQILTVFAADIGLETVTIGTGVAAAAVTTATTALGINAAAAPNALTLRGNAGINTLTGTGFVDTMDGGNGADIYLVTSNAQHSAAEINDSGTSGSDELRFASTTAGQILTVFAADLGLESVTIGTGTAAAAVITGTTALSINAAAAPNGLSLRGNAGINTLTGTSFDDTINGGSGNDTLIGGAGIDSFRFDSSLNAVTNVDRITDFSIAQNDGIQLENAVFTALATTGPLAATAFVIGLVATTANQRIMYNSANGFLSYDPDGNGLLGATQFATLTAGLALTSGSFSVT
jgi:Ca2+-binding RTX toxin-like protein